MSHTPPREKRSQNGRQLGRKTEDPWRGPLEGADAVHIQCPRSRNDDFDGEVKQYTAQRREHRPGPHVPMMGTQTSQGSGKGHTLKM